MTENDTRKVADLERITAKLMGLLGSDPQFAAALPDGTIAEAVKAPGMRLAQMLAVVMEGYGPRPALGERTYRLTTDEAGRTSREFLSDFTTITYAELWRRVGALASAWRHESSDVRPGDFVCTVGRAGIDYTVADLACIRMGAIAVPLPATATESDFSAMLEEVHPAVVCSDMETVERLSRAVLACTYKPRQLVLFDYQAEVDEQRRVFESTVAMLGTTLNIATLESLTDRGGQYPAMSPYVDAEDDNPMAALLYTSGSTGTPKAAICTERMCAMAWTSASLAPAIGLTYMPMSHFYGRGFLYTTLSGGGTNYFVTDSDLSSLFDDLALIRPTALPLVPRVCEMIAQRYHGEVVARVAAGSDRSDAEDDAKALVRDHVLGGRYLWASCASAPLSPAMHTLMEELLDAPLVISYGATEIVGVTIDGVVSRPPVIDYKLVDVPALGYFGTDQPYPRGELLVKTVNAMAGYYKRPDLTAESFDEDGYYRTGDIMAEIAPDRLTYVDRVNNVLKLAQGEFVAVSQLEATFCAHPLIEQIFVYGNSNQSFVVAIVVPDATEAARHMADIDRQIRDALHSVGREAGLKSWEIPRHFLVEHQCFTAQNGLLTASNKLARPKLIARYGARLEQLYADIADAAVKNLRDLHSGKTERPVVDTVERAALVALDLPDTGQIRHARFVDLGGDSMSAMSLANLLEEIFEVDVPVADIIDPTIELHHLAARISDRLDTRSAVPTTKSVHGAEHGRISAAQLTLDAFASAPESVSGPDEVDAMACPPHTVLLTGATGFLGRFQCMELMTMMANGTSGKVVCIVRGRSHADARDRLIRSVADDPAFAEKFTQLAEDHLVVLAGDLGLPRFGMQNRDWNRLCDTVDAIVHTGALVNHALPYRALFAPNVFGTAEVLRLAVTGRLKPVSFTSTVAAAVTSTGSLVDESADIRDASPHRDLDNTYANGYGASKWAAEVLCRDAHTRYGLPVNVFRCSMLLPHRQFPRYVNNQDVLSRLLVSLIDTRLAPGSFYTGDAQHAHFDGLPVDFVARATTHIHPEPDAFRTFNVVNPNPDKVSIDTFVTWLVQAGYPIRHIGDYDEWFSRMHTALRALPDSVRHQTLFDLPSAFAHPNPALPGSAFPADMFCAAVRDTLTADGAIPTVEGAHIVRLAEALRPR
ncbi:thioester reductase domain-containing protein [Mycolicibacterium neoaurum]|uniref:carboxylic acid reductase n=1 Tax=Mycolicibacterium neoaurum TaxID=1795 RepID=UPI00248C0EAA|nr:carboxylic acid reductase [Mycolicibacterium neoaurum]WBP95330.1 thioester reductase domain-containing protein [Mycolicibacterium neoaurum]WBS08372.1 thioester reductase domain-containing protein [Mycolicibacterium neoaurum]